MDEKRPKSLIRFFFSPKSLFLILLLCLVAIGFPISKNIGKKHKVDEEIMALETEISKLEAGNKNLKKMINYLESDQFVEEQARLKFGLKKPGEEVVVVDAAGFSTGVFGASRLGEDQEEDVSNPRLWWNFFFQNKKRQ